MSQRELSAPGVSYAYISRIEAGTRQPSVKALRKLAAKLGVSADYLETGSEVRDSDERELRVANAELKLRLEADVGRAETALRECLEEALAAGDGATATRVRVGLGVAAAEGGRAAEAVELLEAAVTDGSLVPSARPDVYATLGRSYAAVGTPQRAIELFERCLADLDEQAPDNRAAQIRFRTYLSAALTDLGDLERAEEILARAASTAEQLADPYARVRLYWSLGRLAAQSGRASAALEHLRRAIALLEATEDTLQLARANIGYASALLAADRAEDAGGPLAVAERLLGPGPAPQDESSVRTGQAKRAARLGRGADAVRLAREALDVLEGNGNGERAAALLALGQGHALEGETEPALDAFSRAASSFEAASRHADLAQTYRAWGRLLRETGREAEAMDVLEKAADAAVRVPARADA